MRVYFPSLRTYFSVLGWRDKPSSVLSRASSSRSGRRAPARLAITTTSRSSPRSSRRYRNHSRNRLLNRFRTTAFPTFRLAVMPSRLRLRKLDSNSLESLLFIRLGVVITTNSLDARRRPRRKTRLKSLESRSRSDGWKRPVACNKATSLLGRDG